MYDPESPTGSPAALSYEVDESRVEKRTPGMDNNGKHSAKDEDEVSSTKSEGHRSEISFKDLGSPAMPDQKDDPQAILVCETQGQVPPDTEDDPDLSVRASPVPVCDEVDACGGVGEVVENEDCEEGKDCELSCAQVVVVTGSTDADDQSSQSTENTTEEGTQDELSLTSATDSQASSSESTSTKRRRGRAQRVTPTKTKPEKDTVATAIEETEENNGPTTRRRSTRLRLYEKKPEVPVKALRIPKGKKGKKKKDEEREEGKEERKEEKMDVKEVEKVETDVVTEVDKEEEAQVKEAVEVQVEKEDVKLDSEQDQDNPSTADEYTIVDDTGESESYSEEKEQSSSAAEAEEVTQEATEDVKAVEKEVEEAETPSLEMEKTDKREETNDNRNRRYYSSLDRGSSSPLKSSSLRTRRKSRWEDAEPKVVDEPIIACAEQAEKASLCDMASAMPPPPMPPSSPSRTTSPSVRDDSAKPEKVKSRWRRSSELETGDSASQKSDGRTLPPPKAAETRSGSSRIRSPPKASSPQNGRSSSSDNQLPSDGKTLLSHRERTPLRESPRSKRESDPPTSPKANKESKSPSPPKESIRIKKEVETLSKGGYEDIEENVYRFERKKCKSMKEVRRMICDCTLTKDEKKRGIMGCDEDCLNRLLMIECGSRCPIGENCSNRRFQKKGYVKVEKFQTEKKGMGLRTLETLASGTFVMEYVGEVLTPEDFRKRVKLYARENHQHYYFMALRADEIIDATQKGNVSRFINHSCDPNCETQKWTVNGELRIGFFTRRPVRAGEELTFDYQFQRYGKEAQRCYCESSNCRGYIGGEDNKMSLKSGKSVAPKRKKEERKRDTVEDLAMEEEIEKLSGGLRNREHTLLLARLMVRAEDMDTRHRLLEIIQNTTETACLRLFLDYHGLSLLWSWMVDIPENELALKGEILNVLKALPIPNKTMLKDSKVMAVVHRWASELSELKTSGKVKVEREADRKVDSPNKKAKLTLDGDASQDSDASEGAGRSSSTPVVCSPDSTHTDRENGECTPVQTGKVVEDLSQLTSTLLDSWSELKEVFRIPRVEQEKRREDEREADRRERERNRKNREKDSRDRESRDSRDGRDRESRDSKDSWDNRDTRERWHNSPPAREWRRDYERSDRRRFSASPERREEKKSSYGRPDRRGEGFSPKSRKTSSNLNLEVRHSEGSRYDRSVGDSARGRAMRIRPLLPTPPALTKEERRHLFALEVQQRDEEEALRRQYMAPAFPPQPPPPAAGQAAPAIYMYEPGVYGPPPPQGAPGVAPPAFYDPQMGAPMQAAPPQEFMLPQVTIMAPPMGMLPPGDPQHPAQQMIQMPMPPHAMVPVQTQQAHGTPPPRMSPFQGDPLMIPLPPSQSPEGDVTPQNPDPVSSPTLDSTEATGGADSQESYSSIPAYPVHVMGQVTSTVVPPFQQQQAMPTVSQGLQQGAMAGAPQFVQQPAVSGAPVYPQGAQPVPYGTGYAPPPQMGQPGMQPGVPIAVQPGMQPSAQAGMQPVYYIQPHPGAQMVNEQGAPIQTIQPLAQVAPAVVEAAVSSQGAAGEAQPPPKKIKLPPNWKTAKDEEGNIYYYHAITRETQWDPPSGDEVEDDMDLGTPTYDEPKVNSSVGSFRVRKTSKKKTTTAAADTSEVAKKIKELFRTKISSHIVHCLSPYRKQDCKIGRIQSTDDFKHLARKMTHFVLAKELKHCKNVEDLECNENVKHKAREFINKYMAKYGPIYKKDPKDE